MGQNAKRPRHESDENAKKAGAKSDDPLRHWLEVLLEDHGESDEHLVSLFKDAEEAERADTNPDQAPEPPELESQQVIETSETSMDTFLSTLGVEEQRVTGKRFDYFTTQGQKRIGMVHKMGDPGRGNDVENLKATCKLHKGCTCWVHPRTPFGGTVVLKDLIEWLQKGTECDENCHWNLSVAVRRKYGHRL